MNFYEIKNKFVELNLISSLEGSGNLIDRIFHQLLLFKKKFFKNQSFDTTIKYSNHWTAIFSSRSRKKLLQK